MYINSKTPYISFKNFNIHVSFVIYYQKFTIRHKQHDLLQSTEY